MDRGHLTMAKGFKTGGGSRKGRPNKVNVEFRETVRRLLEDSADNMGRWLTIVAEGDGTDSGKPDPGKALDLLAKLAEFAAPKLARTEVTGANGGPVEQVHRIERVIHDPANPDR